MIVRSRQLAKGDKVGSLNALALPPEHALAFVNQYCSNK